MNERAVSLMIDRRDLSDDKDCEDVDLDEDEGFESEEGGMELGNVAMTRW